VLEETRIETEVARLRGVIQSLADDADAKLQHSGIPNHINHARFTDHELTQIVALRGSDEVKGMQIRCRNTALHPAPRAPPLDVQVALENVASGLGPSCGDQSTLVPWWARVLCRDPEGWRNTGLALADDDGSDKVYLTLHLKEQPHEATFLECRRVPHPVADGNDDPEDVYWVPETHIEFEYLEPLRFHREIQLPFKDDSAIIVYYQLFFEGPVVTTNKSPLDFDDFLRRMAPAPPMKGSTAKKREPRFSVPHDEIAAALNDHPWLDLVDFVTPPCPKRQKLADGSTASGGGAGRGDPALPDAPPPLADEDDAADDEDPADLEHIEALADIRADLMPDAVPDMHYRVRVLGYHLTLANTGEAADYVLGIASGQDAQAWADAWDFPASKRFSIAYYGRRNALKLANEFVSRANYFCSLFMRSEEDNFTYSQADIAAYPQNLEFIEWMTDLDVTDNSFVMGLQVRALEPVLG
jgi:hypothetical protein